MRSPKTSVRDSGITHALLGIGDKEALLGHPIVGQTWESFVIETLIAAAPEGTDAHFYRTAAGAEIDLVLTTRLSQCVCGSQTEDALHRLSRQRSLPVGR
jgi:predicted AAA+ superfamily ATPase